MPHTAKSLSAPSWKIYNLRNLYVLLSSFFFLIFFFLQSSRITGPRMKGHCLSLPAGSCPSQKGSHASCTLKLWLGTSRVLGLGYPWGDGVSCCRSQSEINHATARRTGQRFTNPLGAGKQPLHALPRLPCGCFLTTKQFSIPKTAKILKILW